MAQTDSVELKIIEIKDRISTRTQALTYDLNSDTAGFIPTLSGWLSENTPAFVRTNGPSSVATLTIRGGSSSQNLLLWNGIPLNNPMLGLSDYSLANLRFFDKLTLIPGGQSAAYGSSAVSGVISLENHLETGKNQSYQFGAGIGSFDRKELNGQIYVGKEKWASKTQVTLARADNNFSYNTPAGASQKITNNRYEGAALYQSLAWKPADGKEWQLDIWWQDYNRQVPPLSTQTSSEAFQDDSQTRFVLSYNNKGDVFSWQTALAALDEHNNYTDPQILLDARNHFFRWFHYTKAEIYIPAGSKITLGYNFNRVSASSPSYPENKIYYSGSPYINFDRYFEDLTLSLSARKEYSSFNNGPLSMSFKGVLSLSEHFLTGFQLSREYRLPSLNELFWQPGGDEELQPESGWNQELEFIYTKKDIRSALTLYHRLIDNWIIWTTTGENFFFNALNLAKVRSYGLETAHSVNFRHNEFRHHILLSYGLSLSRNLVATSQPMIAEGEQLIYTPEHTAGLNYHGARANLEWSLSNRYTSPVQGINENLPGYLVTRVGLAFKFKHGAHFSRFEFVVENLFNKDYRVIERRPMPGRHFFLQYSIKFKK